MAFAMAIAAGTLTSPAFAAPAPAPTSRADHAEAEALALYRQSSEAYAEGRFQVAAALLNQAYALKREPILLFNLARAYEGMGDAPKAIDAYDRYLEDDPKTSDRKSIEQRIATLKKQVDERATLERERDEERERAERETSKRAVAEQVAAAAGRPSVLPWIIAGAGVAGVGVGTVLAVMSRSSYRDAVDEPYRAPAERKYDSARTDATAANVAFVAGGVFLAGGIVWAIVDRLAARKPTNHVEVTLSPTSFALRSTF